MIKIMNLPLALFFTILSFSTTFAQGDLLNESKIQPIPAEMTFEEYRDANRRLVSGIIVSSLLPVPGMMHLYAGEKKMGYRLMGAAGVGLLSIVAGIATLSGEGEDWQDSDFETIDIGKKRFEKIPVFIYEEDGAENRGYTLRELKKKRNDSGAGAALVILGGGVIIFSHFYDWIHGINTIERKRDRVRFKYGKRLDFSMNPLILPDNGMAGVTLGVKF